MHPLEPQKQEAAKAAKLIGRKFRHAVISALVLVILLHPRTHSIANNIISLFTSSPADIIDVNGALTPKGYIVFAVTFMIFSLYSNV